MAWSTFGQSVALGAIFGGIGGYCGSVVFGSILVALICVAVIGTGLWATKRLARRETRSSRDIRATRSVALSPLLH